MKRKCFEPMTFQLSAPPRKQDLQTGGFQLHNELCGVELFSFWNTGRVL